MGEISIIKSNGDELTVSVSFTDVNGELFQSEQKIVRFKNGARVNDADLWQFLSDYASNYKLEYNNIIKATQ